MLALNVIYRMLYKNARITDFFSATSTTRSALVEYYGQSKDSETIVNEKTVKSLH